MWWPRSIVLNHGFESEYVSSFCVAVTVNVVVIVGDDVVVQFDLFASVF